VSPLGVTGNPRMDPDKFFRNEQFINYTLFNNGVNKPIEAHFFSYDFELPLTANSILIRGTTIPYSLLGQAGFTNVEFELNLKKRDEISGIEYELCTPSIVDNLLTLADDKPAQHITPGQDGTIRILTYDMASDFNNIAIFAIPSSGEEIMLDLEMLQEKREYIAHIPKDLPHEFIDVIVRMKDEKGNKTTYTMAPAFFFGESEDEITLDGRVWMNNYHLENPDDFPFTVDDNLLYTLEYVNRGNIDADSIYVKFPTTAMFEPIHADSISFSITDTAYIELGLKMRQLPQVDTLIAYYPELHWKSNGKSYLRRYPIRIKTWEDLINRSSQVLIRIG
jgi:hypothetical protein